MSGYSRTPLFKKLGYKTGMVAHLAGEPEHYLDLLTGIPDDIEFVSQPAAGTLDFIHLFVDRQEDLARRLPVMRALIKSNGMIWVSWPKKSSKVPTDMTGDASRANAFPLGLVDVKVCAVDEVWTAQKLMIRKELR
jgi:hypothetical protein